MKMRIIVLLLAVLWAAPPLLQAQTIETYTFTTNRLVPDGDVSGLSDVRNINSAIGNIASLKVGLKLTGEFNGDLFVYLRHASGYTVLLNRSGKTGGNVAGYDDSGLNVTFDSAAANDIHLYRNITTPVDGQPLTGTWQPDGRTNDPVNVTDASARTTSLTNFAGLNAAGEWTLYVADVESGATNMITEWTLEITGAAYPTLTWSNPADITYGTALAGTQLNATATYQATNVTGNFAYTPDSGTYLNAGNGQTLSVTFTPTDTASFLPISTNVIINVLKAALTITADSTNKVYGAAVPTLTATYDGFVNSDSAANLTTPVSLTTPVDATSPIGTYAITAAGAASTNYTITQVAGFLTNTPASLTITANSTNKVYGAALPTFTASYSGFVNGDSSASLTTPVTLATTADSTSPTGTYPVTASGAAFTNYTIGFVSGTLTVGTATLTVTADDQSKAFGAELPALTVSYDGFVNSDSTNNLTALAAVATAATSTSAVGTYPLTPSGAGSTNYSFNYVAGTLTVTNSLTTGVVVSSANPALPGANVTFTMTITAVAPGAGTPTGAVAFRIDGSVLGSGGLSGGAATFATNNLAVGTHTVVAEYAGDGNFVGTTNTLTPTQVINTPPVASNDTIVRYPNGTVKVRLATLLANDSDADGDALTPTVGTTSTNGGTLTVSGAWVFYTPVPGFTNADEFTYTIADGRGGSATGTVTIAIKVDTAPSQNLVITSLGGNQYLIGASGIPGYTYRLQSSDSASPFDWLDVMSITADSTGKFSYTDTDGSPMRFYRTVYP